MNMLIKTQSIVTKLTWLYALLLGLSVLPLHAEEQAGNTDSTLVQAAPESQVALSVEELKKQVIKLNRDLFILEEDLLFPANTQLAVYVSFATGQFFNLDSLTLKVDDEVVASHLYTERQLKALARGGMQRLHLGNLKTGEHELVALVHGKGPKNEDYKLAVAKTVNKGTDQLALEIRIEDASNRYQPIVTLSTWDK